MRQSALVDDDFCAKSTVGFERRDDGFFLLNIENYVSGIFMTGNAEGAPLLHGGEIDDLLEPELKLHAVFGEIGLNAHDEDDGLLGDDLLDGEFRHIPFAESWIRHLLDLEL